MMKKMMVEKKFTVKNLKVNYKIIGRTGPPIIILHGWGSSSDKLQNVGELLTDKFNIIIPDLPGFGKSQKPESAWNLDDYVEWLNEFTDKVTELNKSFYLLGHSFGGALAVKFTIRYNQKVERLFLVAAACIRKKTIKKQAFGRISKFVKIFDFLPFYSLIKKTFYKFVVGSSDYIRVQGVMKETFLKAVSEDLSQKLLFVKVPTVIIWGDKDDTTLVEDAHFINGKIENSKLIIIPGTDHNLEQKVPEILSEKIMDNI